jgi:hypothetical protein
MSYKKLILLLPFIVLLSSMVSGELIFNDTFDRADSKGWKNNWVNLSTGYANITSERGQTGRRVDSGSQGGASHSLDSSPNEIYVEAFVGTPASGIAETYLRLQNGGTNAIYLTLRDGSDLTYKNNSGTDSVVTAMSLDTWYSINVTNINYTSYSFDIYVDGSLKTTGSFNNNQSTTDTIALESYTVGAAIFDNLSITNLTALSLPSDSLNVSALSPANNTQHNYSVVNFNVTVNSTSNFTAQLYINNSLNQSANFNLGNTVNVSFDVTLSNGFWNAKIEVNDSTQNKNTSNNIILVDINGPTITFNNPAIANNTEVTDSITLNITVADPNLYSAYWNITYENGTLVANGSNTTLTGSSSYTITDNVSLLDVAGFLLANVKTCDGHTKNKIDIKPSKTKDTLSFDDVKVSMNTKTDTSFTHYHKEEDKYSFEFITKTEAKAKSFIVEGEVFVDILHGKTKYPGHLVIDNKYWVDFETDNLGSVKITRISNTKVRVDVTKKKATKNWFFDSVGELNCNTGTAKFFANNVAYGQYITYGADNYTRNLSYSVSLSCSANSSIDTFIDSSLNYTEYCLGNQTLNLSYIHASEGSYNIWLRVNESGNITILGNRTFQSDLNNPTVNLTLYYTDGFANPDLNISLRCFDSMLNISTYNLTFNYTSFDYGNHTNNTEVKNTTTWITGDNIIVASCSDLFGTNTNNTNITAYTRSIFLINEKNNTLFDVENLTGAKVYFDDNSSLFDFKAEGNVSAVNFTSITTDKLRFEFEYSNGDIITRYVDVSISNGDLRVCANTDPTTHYEQIIISAVGKKVTLKNIFSNCIVAEDYTRFAYQNSLILKAFTIDSLYTLYVYNDNDTMVRLASMDGSIATYYNIDVLEFNAQGYNLDITGDSVTFRKDGNTVVLFYKNLDNDSVSTTVTVTRVNDSTLYYTDTETTNPNEFYLVFDYSTLGINETTALMAEVVATDSQGNTRTTKRYFNTAGSTGVIPSGLAFAIAVLLTIFGLTFTTLRLSLGWFGVMIMAASIAVMGFAVITWYITLLMAMNAIIMVYIVILLNTQNYGSVA